MVLRIHLVRNVMHENLPTYAKRAKQMQPIAFAHPHPWS